MVLPLHYQAYLKLDTDVSLKGVSHRVCSVSAQSELTLICSVRRKHSYFPAKQTNSFVLSLILYRMNKVSRSIVSIYLGAKIDNTYWSSLNVNSHRITDFYEQVCRDDPLSICHADFAAWTYAQFIAL